MACAMEHVLMTTVGCVGLYSLIFLSGSCWLMISMAHDLKCDLHTVADIEKPKSKLNNELREFVGFHSDVMQLSESFVLDICLLLLDNFPFDLFYF